MLTKKGIKLDEKALIEKYSSLEADDVKMIADITGDVMEQLMEKQLVEWEMPEEKIKELVEAQMKDYSEAAERGEDTPFTKMIRDRTVKTALSSKVKEEMDKGFGFARMAKLKLQNEMFQKEGRIGRKDFNMYEQAEKHYGGNPTFLNCVKSFQNGTYNEDGGYLIMEAYAQEVVELLRAKVFLFQTGVTTVPMPRGNLNLPVHEAGAFSYWVGEGGAAPATKQKLGNITFNSKELNSICVMSNRLIENNSYDADQAFLNDMLREMAVMINTAALYGTGKNGQPLGIKNTSGITKKTWDAVVSPELIPDMVGNIYSTNVPREKMGIVFSGGLWAPMYNVTDGVGQYIQREEMNRGTLTGSPFYMFNEITVGATADKYTDVFVGAWENMVVAEEKMFDVALSTEATIGGVNMFERGLTAIKVTSLLDFGIKYPEAFVYYDKVKAKLS
jgi:HK97 family phage major capsid protein